MTLRAAGIGALLAVASAVVVAPRKGKQAFLQGDYDCKAVCGGGVDSSCVPYCQTELYQCHDHDSKVPEGKEKFEECADAVIKKFKVFGEEWEKNKLYFMSQQDASTLVAIGEREHMKEECQSVCGEGVDSSCVPSCEVELFWCYDFDRKVAEGKDKHEECTKKVLDHYKGFGEAWDKEHPR
mmetsp:Transcript_33276/g.75837  ORF Transcript_33276/g.75837 Transcript_33276/m.75837 type:complete len:182 (-) Transcript_33276:64-609(-)